MFAFVSIHCRTKPDVCSTNGSIKSGKIRSKIARSEQRLAGCPVFQGGKRRTNVQQTLNKTRTKGEQKRTLRLRLRLRLRLGLRLRLRVPLEKPWATSRPLSFHPPERNVTNTPKHSSVSGKRFLDHEKRPSHKHSLNGKRPSRCLLTMAFVRSHTTLRRSLSTVRMITQSPTRAVASTSVAQSHG